MEKRGFGGGRLWSLQWRPAWSRPGIGGWAPWSRRAGGRGRWRRHRGERKHHDGGPDGRVLAQAVSMGDLLSSEAAKRAGSYSGGGDGGGGSDPGRDSAFLDSLFWGKRRALQFSFWSGDDIISDVAASAASSRRSSYRSYSAPTPDSRASEEEWVLRLLNPFSPDQQFD